MQLKKLLLIPVGILFWILGVGYGIALWKFIENHWRAYDQYQFFALGVGAMLLIWLIYLSRRQSFWSILEHEITHAFFAVLFFKKVRSISAHRRHGGKVQIEGGNFVIALAPYFFPLFSIILLGLKVIIHPKFYPIWDMLLGFTFMYHWMYFLQEFHPSQPDIQLYGLFFSTGLIFSMNVLFTGLILVSLFDSWTLVGQFLETGALYVVQVLLYIYQQAVHIFSGPVK